METFGLLTLEECFWWLLDQLTLWRKHLTITALSFGFCGAFLGFLAARRVASRFRPDGVAIGYPPEYASWFWRYCGMIGFGFITLAFLLQLIANLLPQDRGGDERARVEAKAAEREPGPPSKFRSRVFGFLSP